MYCHKKGHKEKVFCNKQRDEKYKEKKRASINEEIYYDELFFGDDTLA